MIGFRRHISVFNLSMVMSRQQIRIADICFGADFKITLEDVIFR